MKANKLEESLTGQPPVNTWDGCPSCRGLPLVSSPATYAAANAAAVLQVAANSAAAKLAGRS